MTSGILTVLIVVLMIGALSKAWLRDWLIFGLYALSCTAIPAYVIYGAQDPLLKKLLSVIVAFACAVFVLLSLRRRQIEDEGEAKTAEKFEKSAILFMFSVSAIYIFAYGV